MCATVGLTEAFAAGARRDGISLVIGSGSVAAANLGGLAHELRRVVPRPVVVVLTEGARRFVTPVAVAHLGGCAVVTDEAVAPDATPLHVWLTDLARNVLVYPASAGFIARAATGAATDLASTTLLCATGLPVLVVPSMHPRMWASTILQDNVRLLERAGMTVLPTRDGVAPPVDAVVDAFGTTEGTLPVHPPDTVGTVDTRRGRS